MPPTHIPLNEVSAAVQSAVQQVLAQHGRPTLEQIWIGFVAPEGIATQENATKIAALLGKGAGVQVQPSVGQLAATVGAQADAAKEQAPQRPGHIIGLVYVPKK
jgi:hypothetical protein